MTQTIRIAADDTLSPIRALGSLTLAQADQIVAGLSSLAKTWDIERHESCDGHLSLLLAHAERDITIIVDRDSTGIRISIMVGDQIYASRQHNAITGDAVSAIKASAAAPVGELQRHTG